MIILGYVFTQLIPLLLCTLLVAVTQVVWKCKLEYTEIKQKIFSDLETDNIFPNAKI